MEAEKRRVPSQVVELADVNVLLVGHEGAGTSTFFNNFLKLGKKDKSSQSRHMTQTIRYFETKTMRGYISEHSSWYHHVPDLMSWGSGAGIAILVISGAENDPLSDEEKLKQIVQRVYLIRFLGIPKIVIVINKMDDPTYSLTRFMELKKSVVDVLKRAGYDYNKNDTMSVPISGKSGLNIQTMTRHLRYSGKCLFETLATIDVSQLAMRVTSDQTWSPKEVEELGLFEELFKIDTSIDKDQTDQSKATLWYRRAKIVGKLQLFNAFQDADKAVECNLDLSNNPEYGEEVNDPFLYKIKGDLHYSRQSFDLARENYLHAYEIFNKQRWKKAVEKLQELICTSELLQSEEEEKLKTQTKKKGENKGEKKEELLEENEELKEEKKEEQFDEKKDDELKEEKKKEEIGEKKDDDSILKISIVTDFSLDAKPQDGVYSGYKIRADISLPISIIRCSDYQKQNYQKLLSLGDIGPHVLSIHDMYDFTIEEESSTFFVVQPIKSVDYYYFLKFEGFRNRVKIDEGDKESILTKWWLFIQPEFQKKFRDIVYGLIFLSLKRQKCKSSMYVMNDADGKVLPSMDPNASDGDYLDDLVKKMKSIVKQPHLGHKSALKWLPIDLVHLLNSFFKEKLNHVPMWWLLDHQYFWSPDNCVDFVIKLRGLLKTPLMHKFRWELQYEMMKDVGGFWADHIPDGILKEIWRKGDPNQDPSESSTSDASSTLDAPKESNAPSTSDAPKESDAPSTSDAVKEDGWIKVAPYTQQYDIVRYMTAVYSHYNDDEYSAFRPGGKTVDNVEIEQQLRVCFPKIYGQIANALYRCPKTKQYDNFEGVISSSYRINGLGYFRCDSVDEPTC